MEVGVALLLSKAHKRADALLHFVEVIENAMKWMNSVTVQAEKFSYLPVIGER